ncbi:hematopoietically-expressed homeobox protein HHEX [Anopheles bellator]|uniref:hematopoietically-expressed homeobox protein HHEX n=1 Tax=Anopheles bellator TaxID=139047 RepID=UPI002649D5D7|nr:hematopoietically-expressed homeobox protein HHEX [Anopheles bellator]
MKMGSSKRKSSFRIDDILHQQRDHSLLYQHHAAATAAAAAAAVTAGRQSHAPGSQPGPDGVASLPYPTGPSYGAVPAHSLPVDCTAAGGGRIHRSSSPPGLGPPLAHSAGGGSGSPASIGRSDSPKKPTAVYPGLLDFSKGVIPLPLQLGVPTFNPINAAYLEHYASVLHKATPRAVWPFYTHPYSYLLPPCGSKRKGGQVRFTPQQTQSLEKRFSNHKYLSPEDRRNLAIQLKLSDRQVKTWFQNRRAKWRRANNGCQSTDTLGPTPDSGLGGAGDPTKHPAHATAGYPSLTGCHTKKYPHADDDDEDHASQGGHKDSRSARGVRTAPGYDCKSTDSFSDHEEDGSSDDPDEDDDEPASPINVI